VEAEVAPFSTAIDLLCTIPGIAAHTAQVIIAETGADMSRFPTAAHLASWAGLCPGNHESAGKRPSGRARKGDTALRTALVEAAWAATRTIYLGAQYQCFHRRFGSRGACPRTVIFVSGRRLRNSFGQSENRKLPLRGGRPLSGEVSAPTAAVTAGHSWRAVRSRCDPAAPAFPAVLT
jgi:hypothetical protein